MKSSEQIDKLLTEQSAEWTEALKHGDERTQAGLARWSLKSPDHMRHFLMMVALDRELEHIDPERRIELTSVADSGGVVPLHQAVQGPARPSLFRTPRWAIAACIAGVVAVGYWFPTHSGWREYSTAQGEQRAVELADGSIMHLNTQSQVEVRLTQQGRDIRLPHGEALFKVAKDPLRPFRVHTSDVVIQAVGTQFNVYAQPRGTKVAVLEGRVKISGPASAPANLGAGEEVRIDDKGHIAAAQPTNITTAAAWRQRRLVFNQDPLSEVIAEFNRYNRMPQFQIVDETVGTRPYSGAFDADDPESLVELLAVDPELQIDKSGSQIVIRRR